MKIKITLLSVVLGFLLFQNVNASSSMFTDTTKKEEGKKEEEEPANNEERKIDIGISPRLNFNLTDDPGFSDINPSIFFGFNHQLNKGTNTLDKHSTISKWEFFLEAGPYTSASPVVSDSNHLSNALISPGKFGLTGLLTANRNMNENFAFNFKLGLQAKTMNLFGDSIGNIMQHTISLGFGFTYKDLIGVHATYTYGAHNTTTVSERNFEKAFNRKASDVEYFTLSGLFCLNKNNLKTDNRMYLLVNWYYFPLGNHIPVGIEKFFSIGFVTNMGIFTGKDEKSTEKSNKENQFGNKGANYIF